MKVNSRQHYVPQFYLRGWSEDRDSIWAYPIEGVAPFATSVANVACEKGLYSHPSTDNIYPLRTEQIMAKIEGHYSLVWPNIWDRASAADTRKNLARFVALMALRHPERENQIRRLNSSFRSAVSGMSPDEVVEVRSHGESASCTVAELRDGTKDGKEMIKSTFLRHLPDLIQDLAEVLVQRKWGIVFSERPAFVTSDSPMVLHRGTATKQSIGYGTAGTQILFPISPTRLLAICDDWPHAFAHYKLANLDIFNCILARAATRFVFFQNNDSQLATNILAWRSPKK